jgi:hypothetical protein
LSDNTENINLLQTFLKENEADINLFHALDLISKELKSLESSVLFYKRRIDLLQAWQSRMAEPARTIVCDILANGHTLPEDLFPERYVKGAPL